MVRCWDHKRSGGELRDAARAVLDAWNDETNRATDIVAVLEGPMASLRAALAGRAPRTTSTATRKPREETKQELVLAMLRRDEGASGPQIAEATHWAPHTVRGFLAGLKKKASRSRPWNGSVRWATWGPEDPSRSITSPVKPRRLIRVTPPPAECGWRRSVSFFNGP